MADSNYGAESDGLCDKIAATYNTGSLSDITIKIGESSIPCHKFVLCLQSDWFKKALTGEFMEANTNRISLVDDDEEAARAMIEFCYRDGYTYPEDKPKEQYILFDVQIFTVAEKYLIPSLERYAAQSLEKNINDLAFYMDQDIQIFTAAVELVYDTTSDPRKLLRNIITNRLFKHPDIKKNKAFDELLVSIPLFAADVARAFLSQKDKELKPLRKTYKCICGCSKFEAIIQDEERFTYKGCRNGPASQTGEQWAVYSSAAKVYRCPCGCAHRFRAYIPSGANYTASICDGRRVSMVGEVWEYYVVGEDESTG